MKRRLFMFSIILFFCLMLLFPKSVLAGASSGLLLWFQIVLPTLLPFIIVCNLLIGTQSITLISKIIGPFLSRLFSVSSTGSFVILIGFLCGYPMGAKVTGDLIRNGNISKNEGQYLLSFCNNTSPMFIISFLVIQNLKTPSRVLPVIVILLMTPVLLSFAFRRFHHIHTYKEKTTKAGLNKHFSAKVIDESIMNGFETITKVGGYIMMFSIITSLASMVPLRNTFFTSILLPSLEITNGIRMLCTIEPVSDLFFVLALALTSFGGWCSIAQTHCMIERTGLSLLTYITEKLITALATSLLAYIYIIL